MEALRASVSLLEEQHQLDWTERERQSTQLLHLSDQAEAPRADAERYRHAIRWALGYDEGEPQFEPPEGNQPRYWWRKELQRRAGNLEPYTARSAT